MTSKLKVAVVGQFQRGKSTLVNALIGRNVARLGDGNATTSEIGWYHSPEPRTPRPKGKNIKTFVVKSSFLEHIDLIDTPGFNNTGDKGDAETDMTLGIMRDSDFLLVVLQNKQLESESRKAEVSKNKPREALFSALASPKMPPFLVIMNCGGDRPRPDAPENVKAAQTVNSQLTIRPCSIPGQAPVHLCNIAWACYSMMQPYIDDEEFMDEFGHKENTEHYARLHDTAKIGGYMAAKKIGLDDLYQHSGLGPVREYLSGGGLSFDSIVTRTALQAAFGEWQNDMINIARGRYE